MRFYKKNDQQLKSGLYVFTSNLHTMALIKYFFSVIFFLLLFVSCSAQQPADRATCQNPEFDKKVASWLKFSVPTVSPDDIKKMPDILLLDAREREEFNISHIPKAVFIGYNHFEKNVLKDVPKDKPIVVYCSIGYRSEKMGEKLQKMGFTKVYNLYGSIFEWVNQGNQIVDSQGVSTKKVHTFNRNWSKWVDKGKAEKVW
jgi:rhodanese-related sulfurtransferase